MSRFERHIRRGHPIVFGLIILFSIIELSISAWLVSRFNAHHNYPSTGVRDRTRFLLFTSIWTIVFSVPFMFFFWRSSSSGEESVLTSVGAHGVFLFITWVFWTAGAAAITAGLNGGLDCSRDDISYCGQQNALEAFAWITWILVTFALFIAIWRGISASRRGDGMRGSLV
ncbi:unnamed protein product [Somion occarium]|uniref:MARVEL domain-containing protein n=1 Tax=Somion occarium TaxID=3059160 RepID=A0ABP1CJK9_9APHY